MVSWSGAGRVAGGAFNRAMPVVGGVIDYKEGKDQGEDDIRAAAGATGSTLGGWAAIGASTAAGAAAGGAIGTAVTPLLGTAAGGAIGGVAGFLTGVVGQGLGAAAGGWTADRADELIRGKNTGVKKKMQNIQLDNGDVAQVDDNGNFVGWVVKGGATAAGVNALYGAAQEARKQGLNSVDDFRFNKAMGANTLDNAYDVAQRGGNVLRQGAANSRAGQFISKMGTPGKVLLAGALIDQATGGNAANAIGRGIAGGADAMTNAAGIRTDFDGRNQVSQQAMKEDREQQRVEQNRGISNPYDDEIYRRQQRNNQDVEAYNNRIFQRDNENNKWWAEKADEVSRRNYLTNFTANQANAILQGYMTDIPNSVANSLRTATSARYN